MSHEMPRMEKPMDFFSLQRSHMKLRVVRSPLRVLLPMLYGYDFGSQNNQTEALQSHYS